jgi:hypothetical protein
MMRQTLVWALAGSMWLAGAGLAMGQASTDQLPPGSTPLPAAAPLTALVDQLVDLFPTVAGEILEVRGDMLTLDVGRQTGIREGLALEVFREGREITHPRTGEVLGRTEESLGRVRVTQVQDAFALAGPSVAGIKPGDRFRSLAGKTTLALVSLAGAARESLVEAATQDLVERLGATGRFRVTIGDPIAVFLTQQGIKPDEFLRGQGVREAAERFKADHILAAYFTRVQNKPYMEVRLFSPPRVDPAITTAFFVPAVIKPAPSGGRFSAGGPANPPEAKPRSLLARLLGGDLEAGTYSSGESSIPLRQVARFSYPVLAMDVSVAPKDKTPRMVVSDGDQVYMYRIVEQRMEPEWTKSVRSLGRTISLQLADLDGDGALEVIGNRYDPRIGLNSFILAASGDQAKFLVDDVGEFLFAVDLKGGGVKQTLWAQRFSTTSFFTPGQADQVIVNNGRLVVEKPVRVPSEFRPMGAAFSNIGGKDTRALAFVDRYNRLQISTEGEELWRSSSSVGGGYMEAELQLYGGRGSRSAFYKIEPTPLAVDLDGDGIEELVAPQNLVREGLLAVVFKGPAGFRLQSVNTGFEGGITALGAFRTEDATQPTLIASVVRFNSLLKTSGETQIIMTVPRE